MIIWLLLFLTLLHFMIVIETMIDSTMDVITMNEDREQSPQPSTDKYVNCLEIIYF